MATLHFPSSNQTRLLTTTWTNIHESTHLLFSLVVFGLYCSSSLPNQIFAIQLYRPTDRPTASRLNSTRLQLVPGTHGSLSRPLKVTLLPGSFINFKAALLSGRVPNTLISLATVTLNYRFRRQLY